MQYQQKWPLFDRIKLNEKISLVTRQRNFLELRQDYRLHKRTIIYLSASEFNEEKLHEIINSLHQRGGGEIRLPEGQLVLTKPLIIPSRITLTGVLDRTDIIIDIIDYGIIIQGSDDNLVVQAELKNLRIFHEGEVTFCATILVTHAVSTRLINLSIVAPRAVGLLLADNVHSSTVINCHVTYAGLVGFMLIRNVRETVFKNCSAEHCSQSGMFLTDLTLPEHIDPLDFISQIKHTDEFIGNFAPYNPSDPSPYRIDITNCLFRYNRKMGITTDGVGHLHVRDTVIAHNDCEGITIDNGSWGCSVTSCHIYDNGWRGNQLDEELGIDFVEEWGRMPDGSAIAKLPGISIDNAAYTRIENNHIESNWGDGIKMVRACYAASIISNSIENNNRGVNDTFHYFGILIGVAARQHAEQEDFPSCHNQIIGNDILGKHFAGIHLMLGVNNNTISRNHIAGATFLPIEDHVTLNNTITNSLD